MKVEVRSHRKCCASCNYWGGARELKPNSYGQIFLVENFNDHSTNASSAGICRCPQSMYASQMKAPNSTVCNKYSKWFALK